MCKYIQVLTGFFFLKASWTFQLYLVSSRNILPNRIQIGFRFGNELCYIRFDDLNILSGIDWTLFIISVYIALTIGYLFNCCHIHSERSLTRTSEIVFLNNWKKYRKVVELVSFLVWAVAVFLEIVIPIYYKVA